PPPHSTLFPYTTLFRSGLLARRDVAPRLEAPLLLREPIEAEDAQRDPDLRRPSRRRACHLGAPVLVPVGGAIGVVETDAVDQHRSEEHTSELQSLAYLV